MKKILASLLAVAMLLTLLPISVSANTDALTVGGINGLVRTIRYDNTLGAYAPEFIALQARDLYDYTMEYDGVVSGGGMYTKPLSQVENKLTTEPVPGTTYYSYIKVDLYPTEDVELDYDYSSIEENFSLTIPGYDVAFYSLIEREMGSYLEIRYTLTRKTSTTLYVGGVSMGEGTYLANGKTATQTTKPSGGYAYYKDGVLTLNNYTYKGKGYEYKTHPDYDYFAVVYAENHLEIKLVGTNTLTQTQAGTDGIEVVGSLTMRGSGTLKLTAPCYGISVAGDMTVESGTYVLSSKDVIFYVDGNLTINGGTYDVQAVRKAFIADGDLTVTDGTITIEAGTDALGSNKKNTVIDGGKITIYSGTYGIFAFEGNLAINGGTIFVDVECDALCADNHLIINGGVLDVSSNDVMSDENYYALKCRGKLLLGTYVKLQAATSPEGTIKAFDGAKVETYDRVITPCSAHTYKKVAVTKATLTANGKHKNVCQRCGYIASKQGTTYKASSIKLSKTSYTYNGKVQKPSVVVKDSAGKTVSSSNYTVTYASGCKNVGTYKVTVKFKNLYSGTKTLTYKIKPIDVSKCKITLSKTSFTYNGKVQKPTVTVKNASGTKLTTSSYTVTYASGRKNVGEYKVTIKMKGNYTGTKTLTFKVIPAKTTLKSLTAGSKKLTVKWTKKTTQVTGYQIQYSTSKSFKSYKAKTISKNSTTSTTLTGLEAKTTYYVRVRTYKTVNGKKIYSGWTTVEYKKTK